MTRALLIDPADHVATLLADAAAGDTIDADERRVVAREPIARGHKVALTAVEASGVVFKFGMPIGHATRPIAPGEHVHSHNLATGLAGTLDYRFEHAPPAPAPAAVKTPCFDGYIRADGRVGTRNEIWILPTVGCVGRTAQRIAAAAAPLVGDRVDGVHAFVHPFGCSQLGDDLVATRRLLAALADHPNAGGVLIVGLGCESNQIAELIAALPPTRHGAVRTLVAQAAADEVGEGVALVEELATIAGRGRRKRVGLDRLVLGVKCGGSDGFSGLTANPLVGRVADRVAAAGGRVVLTEIPEIFGAERLLMSRSADRGVFDAIVALVNDFKRYFLAHGEPVSENPSPGNIAGGITTLEEKSLGAVQKGGRVTVTDVRRYGESVRRDGLTLLEAPGNDAVSSTALSAAGATLILFTTGRGTPMGFPAPTLKIATNAELAGRKPGWIDFDASQVLDTGFEHAEQALLDAIAAAATGAATAAERNGEREIAIWKRGITL